MKRSIVDFITFQAAWFACVLGATRGTAGIAGGVAVALFVAALHVALRRERGRELLLIGLVCVLGTIADAALMAAGITAYRTPEFPWPAFLAPPWISALWLVFAILLRDTLSWLRRRLVLAALLGAVGGPLSCLTGVGYGALELHPNQVVALTVLAVFWGIMTPLLVCLPERVPFAGPSDLGAPLAVELKP